jgi:hypothetical protein
VSAYPSLKNGQSPVYSTPSNAIHFHPRWVQGSRDLEGAKNDLCMVGLDLLGNIAIANVELFPYSTLLGAGLLIGGLVVDIAEAKESWNRIGDYRTTGHMTSSDILDSVGWIPDVGAVTDAINALSKQTGMYLEYTP